MEIRKAVCEDITTISKMLAISWKSAYRGIVADNYLNLLENHHWVDFLSVGLNNEEIFARYIRNSYDNEFIADTQTEYTKLFY